MLARAPSHRLKKNILVNEEGGRLAGGVPRSICGIWHIGDMWPEGVLGGMLDTDTPSPAHIYICIYIDRQGGMPISMENIENHWKSMKIYRFRSSGQLTLWPSIVEKPLKNHWKPLKIIENQWKSIDFEAPAVDGKQWKAMKIDWTKTSEHHWQSMQHQWKTIKIIENQWKSIENQWSINGRRFRGSGRRWSKLQPSTVEKSLKNQINEQSIDFEALGRRWSTLRPSILEKSLNNYWKSNENQWTQSNIIENSLNVDGENPCRQWKSLKNHWKIIDHHWKSMNINKFRGYGPRWSKLRPSIVGKSLNINKHQLISKHLEQRSLEYQWQINWTSLKVNGKQSKSVENGRQIIGRRLNVTAKQWKAIQIIDTHWKSMQLNEHQSDFEAPAAVDRRKAHWTTSIVGKSIAYQWTSIDFEAPWPSIGRRSLKIHSILDWNSIEQLLKINENQWTIYRTSLKINAKRWKNKKKRPNIIENHWKSMNINQFRSSSPRWSKLQPSIVGQSLKINERL